LQAGIVTNIVCLEDFLGNCRSVGAAHRIAPERCIALLRHIHMPIATEIGGICEPANFMRRLWDFNAQDSRQKKGCLRTLFNLAINRQNSDYFP
jgi:hypothetical protein